MKETLLTVLENTRLADGIYRLRLGGHLCQRRTGAVREFEALRFFPPPPHLRVRLGERGSDPDL